MPDIMKALGLAATGVGVYVAMKVEQVALADKVAAVEARAEAHERSDERESQEREKHDRAMTAVLTSVQLNVARICVKVHAADCKE